MKCFSLIKKAAVLGALALVPATAVAQPAAGEWEITLGANGNTNEELDNGNFSLGGSVGYFFTDNWEAAVRQTIGYASGPENWNGSTRIAADYHFLMGRFVPFIGANIGYLYGDRRNETWGAGPEGGIKYYVHEKTFVFGMAEYQFLFDRARDIDDNLDNGNWVFTVGVGFNL